MADLWDDVTEALTALDASAWISVIAVLVACIAAFFAKREADAAIRQTELQEQIHRDSHQPYVWVDFRLDATQGSLMHLVVRNEGPTVAEDVRIAFDPPIQGVGTTIKSLEPVHAQLSEGLRSMPPGREMKWAFAMGHRLYGDEGSEVPHRYTVTITGRGPYGDLPTLTYPLDLDEMREMAAPRLGSLEHVAKAIEKLAKQQPP
jgi:hypothetical protein